MKAEWIHSVFSGGLFHSQTHDWQGIAVVAKERWRVVMHHDRITRQSHGKVSRWDGRRWQEVYTLLPEEVEASQKCAERYLELGALIAK